MASQTHYLIIFFATGKTRKGDFLSWVTRIITWITTCSKICHCMTGGFEYDGNNLFIDHLMSGDRLCDMRLSDRYLSMYAAVRVPVTQIPNLRYHFNARPYMLWPSVWRVLLRPITRVQDADNCLSRTCNLIRAGGSHQITKNVNSPASLFRFLTKDKGYEYVKRTDGRFRDTIRDWTGS